jgi:hypothetical protein
MKNETNGTKVIFVTNLFMILGATGVVKIPEFCFNLFIMVDVLIMGYSIGAMIFCLMVAKEETFKKFSELPINDNALSNIGNLIHYVTLWICMFGLSYYSDVFTALLLIETILGAILIVARWIIYFTANKKSV